MYCEKCERKKGTMLTRLNFSFAMDCKLTSRWLNSCRIPGVCPHRRRKRTAFWLRLRSENAEGDGKPAAGILSVLIHDCRRVMFVMKYGSSEREEKWVIYRRGNTYGYDADMWGWLIPKLFWRSYDFEYFEETDVSDVIFLGYPPVCGIVFTRRLSNFETRKYVINWVM